MYIATVPNRNSPPAILLRESFRQRTRSRIAPSPTSPTGLRSASKLSAACCVASSTTPSSYRGPLNSEPSSACLFVLKQIAEALGIGAALGHSRLAKLALFLVLARVAHQGSRLSAVRWAQDQAVAEVLGLGKFDEDDLYAALDDSGGPSREDREGPVSPLSRCVAASRLGCFSTT